MTYHLQHEAARLREQAEAYENLANLLQRIKANAEPAPIRELAAALAPMGLLIVHRPLLVNIRECLDPSCIDPEYDCQSNENQLAYANALRDLLHPKLAEQNPTLELPL